MTDYVKEPHTTIFAGQTGCGKTHLALDLIEKEYKKHFDYSSSYVQHSKLTKRTMSGTESKVMIRFGL